MKSLHAAVHCLHNGIIESGTPIDICMHAKRNTHTHMLTLINADGQKNLRAMFTVTIDKDPLDSGYLNGNEAKDYVWLLSWCEMCVFMKWNL